MRLHSVIAAVTLCSAMAANSFAALVITEVMSNSDHPGGAANGDWWELTNTGPGSVDLENYYWDDGDGFGVDGAVFPAVSVSAGQTLAIVNEGAGDIADFVAAWGGGFTALSADDFGGTNDFSGLSSGGDQVDLYTPSGTLVDSAVFGDSDGGGKSFEWDATGASLGFSVAGENGAFLAPGDGAGGTGVDVGSPGFAPVPEPATCVLFGLAVAGLAVARKRAL